MVYLQGVPIAWNSKQQVHVSLSSSEAEYISINKVVKEVLLIKQALQDMHIKVKLPINIFCDNVGAIQMVRHNVCGTGTRHVNVRYHFVSELQRDIINYFTGNLKTIKQRF